MKDISQLVKAPESEEQTEKDERGWFFGKKLVQELKWLRPGQFLLIDYPGVNPRNIRYILRKRHGIRVKAFYLSGNRVLLSPPLRDKETPR
jgi:hypothetical protein